jgi:hypothetical protein
VTIRTTATIHALAVSATALLAAAPAHAELSAEELAKLAQNPVGNLISVPFQNNSNLNAGPDKRTQNILNIQPVIPISVSDEWNIITRTIVPVISQPLPDGERTNGIGDTVLTAFLSPAKPGKWIWGAGPVLQIPTNSNSDLGNRNWGLGPSVVVLHLDKGDPWVYGVLANNIWSLSDSGSWRFLQQRPDPAVCQLQLPGRLLRDERADHYRQLEGRQQPALDGAAGRRRGEDLPPRSAAGEYAALGLLQRRHPG